MERATKETDSTFRMDTTLGERFKQIRKRFNLTQKEFAESLGVTSAAISKIEKNSTKTSRMMIKFISLKYDVNEEWLLTGKGVAQEQGWWHPVIEWNFPSDDRYILLSFSNFSLPMIGRYEEDEEGGAFYLGDEDETCVSQDLIVNAWMELPQQYKELDD